MRCLPCPSADLVTRPALSASTGARRCPPSARPTPSSWSPPSRRILHRARPQSRRTSRASSPPRPRGRQSVLRRQLPSPPSPLPSGVRIPPREDGRAAGLASPRRRLRPGSRRRTQQAVLLPLLVLVLLRWLAGRNESIDELGNPTASARSEAAQTRAIPTTPTRHHSVCDAIRWDACDEKDPPLQPPPLYGNSEYSPMHVQPLPRRPWTARACSYSPGITPIGAAA